MVSAQALGQLISSRQVADLVKKNVNTSFEELMETWTSDLVWNPMRLCGDFRRQLADTMNEAPSRTPLAPCTPHVPVPEPITPLDSELQAQTLVPPQLQPELQEDIHRIVLLQTEDVLSALLANVKLGSGSFGSVYRYCLGNVDLALKIPLKVQDALDHEMLVSMLSKLRHDNIVCLKGLGTFDPADL